MQRYRIIINILIFILVELCTHSSIAITRVDINSSNLEPLPIAIPDFTSDSMNSDSLSYIHKVITEDLTKTRLFKILPNYTDTDLTSLKDLGISALVTGEVKFSDKNIIFHLVIWDIYSRKKLFDRAVNITSLKYRQAAHKLADHIYENLTGDKGYFTSKIACVNIPNQLNKYKRILTVMDYDGANPKNLTSGDHLVMTPRIDPGYKNVLYLSYENPKKPKVKIINIDTGKKSVVGVFPGMTYAPRFTSKENEILLSLVRKGISNIHIYNLRTGKDQQITKCNSICTSASESPDGKSIVFNSDMSGGRHIFTMDKNGANIKRISFGEGYYTTPVWSPRGDLIAFTKSIPGEGFFIGVMKPDGSNERLIAAGWLVEGPSWSPNGRLILFEKSDSRGKSKLHTIDISGNFEDIVPTKYATVDGNWASNSNK